VAIALLIIAALFVMRSRRRRGGSENGSEYGSNNSDDKGIDIFAIPRKVKDTFAAARAARASTASTYRWKWWDDVESSRDSMPPLPAPPKQTNSQMLDTLMQAAYDVGRGRNDMERGNLNDEKGYVDDKQSEMQQQYGMPPAMPQPPPATEKPISKWLQGILTPRQSKMPSERGIMSMYSQSATSSTEDSMSSSSSDFFLSRNDGRQSWMQPQQQDGFNFTPQQVQQPQVTYSAGRPNVLLVGDDVVEAFGIGQVVKG
jgi:hypothetical protein